MTGMLIRAFSAVAPHLSVALKAPCWKGNLDQENVKASPKEYREYSRALEDQRCVRGWIASSNVWGAGGDVAI